MSDRPIFAFVLMPFDPKFDDVYRIGIQEAAALAGVVAQRLDEQIFVEGMLDRIYRQIEAADIVIADMTGKNPNVFYEVGYAHAKDKLCILQTSDADDIPFDLKHRRHIVYRGSLGYLREELAKNLHWAVGEVRNIRMSQLRVEFRPAQGELIREGNWRDIAKVHCYVDIYNDSNVPSAEISAIYLYTGFAWMVAQGETACPRTKSDVDLYSYRHFLTPPARRLEAGSWAQLQFSASRVAGVAFQGDTLKDEYNYFGSVMLRFATNRGVFDHVGFINVRVGLYPF